MKPSLLNQCGFTLIELLIVVAMLGLVTTAIFGLYETTQSTASTQDEVVEVQQNLRIGLDQMARDIRNAGFMINKSTSDPLVAANATALSLRTAAVPARMARVVEGPSYTAAAGVTTNIAFSIALADMVDFFEAGDWVRIIRPPAQQEPVGNAFQVAGKDRTGPTITIAVNNTSAIDVTYQPGDVIVRVPSSATTLPRTIAYSLAGDDLMRNDGTSTRVVASKFSSIAFEYLEDDVWVGSVASPDLGDVTAVRITLGGQTANTKYGIKTRELTGVVTLRN